MRRQLAIAICGTLALGVLAFGAFARWEVRSEALAAADLRLETVTSRTADLIAATLTSQRTQMAAVARDSSVWLLASTRTGPRRDSAAARLFRADSLQATVLSIEIWDTTGTLRHATGAPIGNVADSTRRRLLALLPPDDSVWIGRFVTDGDRVAYPTLATIRGAAARVVIWRRVASADQSRNPIIALIGSRSRLTVGNAGGVVWSDLTVPVAAPPAGAADSVVTWARPDGERVLVRRALVSRSPWAVAVEFPASAVTAGAEQLTRQLVVAALVLLTLGTVIAFQLGHSLSRPIANLAAAADRMRSGDYGHRVPVTRRDELGALTASFNAMADAIADGRSRLQAHAEDLRLRGDALAEQSRQTEFANAGLRAAAGEAERARASLQAAMTEHARTAAELDAALSSAPVGFGFHDTSLRYVRVNARLAGVIGRAPDAIVGRLPSEVLPDIGVRLEEGLSRALNTNRPVHDVELPLERSGTDRPDQFWLATMFPIRTRDAGLVGIGSVMLDMTDHRALERRFLHAQRMEAVGRLSGGIAHDFNNILTAIASFTSFAIDGLPPGHPAVDDLEQVRMAVARATALVSQLLAFSRQQAMLPLRLNLSDVARSVVPMLRRLVPEHVVLRHDLDAGVWPVLADPGRIEQVLVNLVVNAVDAMPDGGKLAIHTANATLDGRSDREPPGATPGDYAVLSVSDSGVGMDEETMAQAFEPFFSTKGVRGTGLGLSTVYGIVRQSAGHVRIDSEPGRGTTVTAWFPRHDEDVPAQPPPSGRTVPRRHDATILLVEDERLVRLAVRKILQTRGHRVLEASDGEAALALLANEGQQVDLVITDLVMPRVGGRELGLRIRDQGNLTPVLYMSGYAGDTAVRQSLLEPGSAFLEKPFTPAALLLRVDELLMATLPSDIRGA